MKKWTRCIHNSTPNLSLDQWKYVPLEKYSSLNKKSSLTSNQGLGPRNLGWTFYGEFFFKGNIVLDTWNLCFWKKWPSLGLWNTLSLSLCVVSLLLPDDIQHKILNVFVFVCAIVITRWYLTSSPSRQCGVWHDPGMIWRASIQNLEVMTDKQTDKLIFNM